MLLLEEQRRVAAALVAAGADVEVVMDVGRAVDDWLAGQSSGADDNGKAAAMREIEQFKRERGIS